MKQSIQQNHGPGSDGSLPPAIGLVRPICVTELFCGQVNDLVCGTGVSQLTHATGDLNLDIIAGQVDVGALIEMHPETGGERMLKTGDCTRERMRVFV